jgi:general secretion pathway protein M
VTLKERFAGLEARERRMVVLMGGVFVALLLIVLPAALAAAGSAKQGELDEIRRVMGRLEKSRALLAKQEGQNAAVLARYASPAPPLATFIDGLTRAQSLEVPESQDMPAVPHGKAYEERTRKIVLRKVSLLPLTRLLEQVVNSGHPVVISRLNLRRRSAEPDSYDSEIVVSAFDAKAKPAVTQKPAAPQQGADTADGESEQ